MTIDLGLLLEVLQHAAMGLVVFLLLAPVILNEAEQRGRRGGRADVRARAHVRLGQGEALPWDDERP